MITRFLNAIFRLLVWLCSFMGEGKRKIREPFRARHRGTRYLRQPWEE